MAAFVAADVTYTVQRMSHDKDSRNANLVKLVFGDGVKTYAAGGIPLTIGNLGCPNSLESAVVFDQGTSGYVYSVDIVNKKLVMRKMAGTVSLPLIEATSDAPAAQTILMEVVGY